MRFDGQEYDGEGVVIAVIDSGLNTDDERFLNSDVQGCRVRMAATNHVVIDGEFDDQIGHGTEIAATILHEAPNASLLVIRIMDDELVSPADLIAVGIETAYKSGANVINLSLGTPNMGKAMLLRDCCAMAKEAGTLLVASAHPQGGRIYPADIPEAIGVASHPDCGSRIFYFDPMTYPRKKWKGLSGKFLTGGRDITQNTYVGVGHAAAYMSGRFACLRQALPDASADELIHVMQNKSFVPTIELGYRQ